MNLQEQFYQVMTRLKANSRAASTKDDARVTEMINGLLVSKPAKKVEEVTETKTTTTEETQPKVWNLTRNGPVQVLEEQQSKAGSVPGINKIKAIHAFINSNGIRFSFTGDRF
jgi:hypothetical protein